MSGNTGSKVIVNDNEIVTLNDQSRNMSNDENISNNKSSIKSNSTAVTSSFVPFDAWPEDAAKNVIFQVPSNWTKTSCGNTGISPKKVNETASHCRLMYDEDNRFVRIVDAEDSSICWDVIDVDDMIGASVELHVHNESFTSSGKANIKSYENEPTPSKSSDPLLTAKQELNEPFPSDQIQDKKGSATLSIFVYPREDYSKQNLLSTLSSLVTNMLCSFMYLLGCGATPVSSTAALAVSPQPDYKRRAPTSSSNSKGPDPTFGQRFPNHRTLTLLPVDDFTHVQLLTRALSKLAHHCFESDIGKSSSQKGTMNETLNNDGKPNQNKRCLIIINPCSGPKKNGVEIGAQIVQPMLEQAGYDVDTVVTTYRQHACEIVSAIPIKSEEGEEHRSTDIDITKYGSLVLVGGDGIVHEVLNGIYSRPDCNAVLRNISIGIVGSGTANGMASSLVYASRERCGPLNEAFLVAKRCTATIDVSKFEVWANHPDYCKPSVKKESNKDVIDVSQTSAVFNKIVKNYVCCLTFSWAIISDVDIESECIHWFGARRFDVWCIYRLIFLRKYRAKFSYKPCTGGTNNINDNGSTSRIIPAIDEPVPEDWKIIEDDFVLFYPSHVTHAGMNVFNSPPSTLHDGIFQVMILRGNLSRLRLLMILLGFETGTHVGMSGCEFIECSAFRLEPDRSNPRQCHISKNNIDGEVVEDGPIQGFVIPGAVRVYCKP